MIKDAHWEQALTRSTQALKELSNSNNFRSLLWSVPWEYPSDDQKLSFIDIYFP